MPGSNGKSSYEDLFGEYEDGQINTSKDFKSFEKTISSDEWKEDLVQACQEDSEKVVAAFDATQLEAKVQQAKWVEKKAKSSRKDMKPEVQEAYLVIWKMKDWKQWTYQELLESAETEVTLEKAKQNLLDKINSNSDWNESLKVTARNVIEDLFAECDSVEEFERRAWTRLSTVEWMDNIWDFLRAIPRTIMEANKGLHRQALELMKKVWVTAQEINEICKQAIESGILKMKDFIDRCKEKWMAMVDIAKTVCERWQSQFANFIAALKEAWEDITDALKAAREWTWKQWNNFVEFCGWKIEDLKEFGIMLVEKWELMWNQLVDWFMNSIESAKELCKALIEKGLVKMREFAEWCVWLWEKWKELIVSLIEWNVNLWNDFADFCKDKWETMKDIFTTVATELLQKWKIALEAFAEWCKWAWETVKDAACLVLVWLVKAWKIAIEAVIDTIVVVVWLPVMAVSKLLIAAWKEIYKDVVAAAEFIGDLSAALREKAKQFWISAADFVKDFINQCKEFALMSADYIAKVVGSLREKMKEAWMVAADFIRATYETVKWALGNAWNKTAEFFKNLWLKVEDIAVTLREASKWAWEWCVNFVVKSYRDFNNALNLLVEKCKIGIDKIGEAIMAAWVKVAEFVKYVKEKALITFENISKWCKWVQEKIDLFIKTALETVKATWEDLVAWCWWQLDKLALTLKNLYWKTKEWVKKLIGFLGKTALEAWKILLTLWIAIPALVIWALKELGCALKNVAELCVKYAKVKTQELCDLLMNAYWATKEWIVKIWESVAAAVKEGAKDVMDWIYKQTNNAKEAIRATKEYISNWIKDICEWMYNKWIQLKDICRTVCEEFKWNVKEIVRWLKAFAKDCAIKWNDLVAVASEWLTIDV